MGSGFELFWVGFRWTIAGCSASLHPRSYVTAQKCRIVLLQCAEETPNRELAPTWCPMNAGEVASMNKMWSEQKMTDDDWHLRSEHTTFEKSSKCRWDEEIGYYLKSVCIPKDHQVILLLFGFRGGGNWLIRDFTLDRVNVNPTL